MIKFVWLKYQEATCFQRTLTGLINHQRTRHRKKEFTQLPKLYWQNFIFGFWLNENFHFSLSISVKTYFSKIFFSKFLLSLQTTFNLYLSIYHTGSLALHSPTPCPSQAEGTSTSHCPGAEADGVLSLVYIVCAAAMPDNRPAVSRAAGAHTHTHTPLSAQPSATCANAHKHL